MLDSRRGEGSRAGRRGLRLLIAAAILVAAVLALRTGGRPTVELESDLPGIGPRTIVTARGREPGRGLTGLVVELVQGERVVELAARTYEPLPAWKFWGARTAEATLEVPVGSEVTPGLVEGDATVRVTARGARAWLRGAGEATAQLALPVRLTPPRIAVVSSQHYPTQGGSEAVVYRLDSEVARHGVEAGEAFFPGYELPGGGNRFALFAVPYDLAPGTPIRLVAVDDVGNRSEREFVDRLRPREIRSDRVELSDEFMARVAPAIEAQTPGLSGSGSLVDRYLAINSGLRAANRRTVAELAAGTARELLWQGPFLAMPNGQVMARFADHRTYLYGGAEIDRQDHLGYDLASVQHAPVPAANAGVVVMAEFLGIYGNVVIVDHGYGLMSLYGHLSALDVTPGDRVERGQTLGRTGMTGLAGGDHLHFGIFLQGVPVDPVEWLDADWIRNRVSRKLDAGGSPA
ncbi:MAG: M23 family metallopeptidase [Acidobacteriota bacterium]|nr:M23 family metallopeptidase [Acidobacteriota bacterium]